MKGKWARSIGVVVTAGLLAVTTAGMAMASGGGGSSATQSAGKQLLQQRDQLTRSAYGGDVAATSQDLARVQPMLADVAGGKKFRVRSDDQNTAAAAQQQAAEASRILADPNAATARQLPPTPGLPPLPGPLAQVGALIQGLLQALTGLISSLLGGAVPPLPVPGAPSAPAPGAPAPAPVPGAPVPGAPLPAPLPVPGV